MNAPRSPSAPGFLAVSTVMRLTPSGPVFLEQIEDGDLAYYGLVLQSGGPPALVDYLLSCAKGSLWEYQRGYGPTAADTALVVEGLLEHGLPREQLAESLRRVVQMYFVPEEGAFKTVSRGKARYWSGPSADTTAHVGYLLFRVCPEEQGPVIEKCARYVASAQEKGGLWGSRWFPSHMIPTYWAARFLACLGGLYSEQLEQAVAAILRSQREDGSFSQSVIETSAALLALATLERAPEARERAARWISSRAVAGQWEGEPLLCYWFDEPGEQKRLYFTRDKGGITTAWARLALRSRPAPGTG